MLGEVFDFAAARAAIFAALVFAAVKAFFLLFFTEVVHACAWGCGGSLWRCGVFAAAAVVFCELIFSVRDQKGCQCGSYFFAGINFFNVVSCFWHENNQVLKQALKVGAIIDHLMIVPHGRAINRGQFDQEIASGFECVVHALILTLNSPPSNRKRIKKIQSPTPLILNTKRYLNK